MMTRILAGYLLAIVFGGFVAIGLLYAVGETIDTIATTDCPPFDQCTPSGSWNARNCKCWDTR